MVRVVREMVMVVERVVTMLTLKRWHFLKIMNDKTQSFPNLCIYLEQEQEQEISCLLSVKVERLTDDWTFIQGVPKKSVNNYL